MNILELRDIFNDLIEKEFGSWEVVYFNGENFVEVSDYSKVSLDQPSLVQPGVYVKTLDVIPDIEAILLE